MASQAVSQRSPDYHDADIILRLYDLRREAVMRQSRDAMIRQFCPATYEELLAVSKWDHPLNSAFRQVSSYWEMATSFARHGIVSPELLAENAGEAIYLYCKLEPYLERFRKEVMASALVNTEWLLQNTETGKQKLEVVRRRVQQMQTK